MAKRKVIFRDRDAHLPAWSPFLRGEDDPRTPEAEMWVNSRYVVHLRRYPARDPNERPAIHLSIKRRDQGPDISYREKQRIKDALLGPEYDLLERYPPRSEEIDTANQYHLWGIDDPTFRWPIGWHQRRVTEVSIDGSKHAPFEEKPSDLMDKEALRIRLEEEGLK